ncbi:hypothetical protein MSAN_02518100 [Mycena sanguinolenta]|uniref:Cytochrome P450 n=1 Tax=Mycena sanguinolenta TaxID=230812 RepID=A0A8H6TXE6_9AGAR|nr:hypothetical protein MSAN_02518100 [Mycena sanguinolenta]
MFEHYGICVSAAIFSFFLLSTVLGTVSSPRAIVHDTHKSIRDLLDPPCASTDTLLRSRSSPNARLLRAFHLSNTFVSPDPTVYANFLHWTSFNDVALHAVELTLPELPIPFHVFIRSVTLRTIIVGLLDPHTDMTSLASNDVDIVTNLITDIWMLSKKPGPIPEYLLEMLNDRLRHLIPNQGEYPNPLDFVIPTWETLWRVVAVTLAYVHTDAEARRAFLDLTDNPDGDQFCALKLDGTAPSVENYMSESLRLHPPAISPHHFPSWYHRISNPTPTPKIHVADIESAQRSVLWESDSSPPEAFDAARFLREPKACEILAFGTGPLKCTAINWAPMAAALIVGTILNRVDGVNYYIVRGERVGERTGWDGWMVRKVA